MYVPCMDEEAEALLDVYEKSRDPDIADQLIESLFQQIAGFWLLPIRVQEGRSSSAAQETRALHQPDEKLQACVESAIPVEAAGENCRVGCRPFWMSRSDAKDSQHTINTTAPRLSSRWSTWTC